MNQYYSIFINIRKRRCVVIGGGQVAFRKVRELLVHDAEIAVIDPRICSGLADLAKKGEIQIIRRNYLAGDMDGAYLAVIATGNKRLNKRAAKEAKFKKVLVNVVDDPELSDFIVPSILHRGDISVAVSTGGKSPALARKIRTGLEKHFADEYAALAELISSIRTELHEQGIRIKGDEWQRAMNLDLLIGFLNKGDEKGARKFLLNKLINPKYK